MDGRGNPPSIRIDLSTATGDVGGLGSRAAAEKLAREGPNALPDPERQGVARIVLEILREPMFVLLVAAAAIYVALGDTREAIVLGASVVVVIAITFHQERKAGRALEALRELASPRAHVRRDGQWEIRPARELVTDDVILLQEGDRVPADARLVQAVDLRADESLLTGESAPVRKRPGEDGASAPTPGGDDLPFVYMGTLITRGHGIARVVATGPRTEAGRIGASLRSVEPERSPTQQEIRIAVRWFAIAGLSLCVAVTILYGVRRGDWLDGLLAGITLAMANLPEEFPVVLTVFMALGAWRISKRGVLTRRAPAIETLGATTVLCVDKTGTLTENRMAVQRLWVAPGREGERPPEEGGEEAVIEHAVRACAPQPFDPMEKAFHRLARERLPRLAERLSRERIVHAFPLTAEQLSVAYAWEVGPEQLQVSCKGAPEAVVRLCGLSPAERADVEEVLREMTSGGLRVLAVAYGTVERAEATPGTQQELHLRLAGLIGLADPVRPGVADAIRLCRSAGIRVVMITGDHARTAAAIARQIGLTAPDGVLSGPELARMSDRELEAHVGDVDVFARIMPEQKLRLVRALQHAGEIVAMTGDGVNDAPALKAAHIGVAMGARGSDVAREAASLVLVDDAFDALVHAVALGRRIFDNIQKATRYIVAVHVPTAGLALLPVAIGWPPIFYPVHIVFLEFVIDPACSIAFEAEPAEPDVMRRPPRPASARLFDAWVLQGGVAQGLGVLVAVALLYGFMLAWGTPEAEARAMAFTSVVLGNLGMILANRTRGRGLRESLRRPNAAVGWIAGATLAALAGALYVPVARDVFAFAAPSAGELLASAAAAAAGVAAGLAWPRTHKARGVPAPPLRPA